MKLFITLVFMVLLSACGVSRDEYDQLKAELEETKSKLSEAQEVAQKQAELSQAAVAKARIAEIKATKIKEDLEEQLENCR